MIKFNQYNSTEELFNETAEMCRVELERALTAGHTALVVSGGTTPQPLFERLSEMPLNWSDVTILPSDERWLDPSHTASNERLIREHLVRGQASQARVQGFKLEADSPFDAEEELNEQLSQSLNEYAVAVVGLGLDGHFASLFPGTPQLADAMRFEQELFCSAIDATGCPVAGDYTQRMTLTLSAILKANRVILLFKGDDKIELIKKVLDDDPSVRELPVYQLLNQTQTDVDICCAS